MALAKIVLGLQFGDEGKGMTTDHLCQEKNDRSKIVVRFSGGQQAGHNVKIKGINHIHSNFGSGTLRGFPSYFTEHCTIYPATIIRELSVLESKGINPDLTIHPLANITTPYDVAFNRITERNLLHGSCGLGISATMKRNIESGYKLFAVDLTNITILNQKLSGIKEYYREKMKNFPIDLSDYEDQFYQIVDSEMPEFIECIESFFIRIRDYSYLQSFNEIIFEGSQGILLDMDHGIFPNVTFANTTSKNAIEVCKQMGISDIEIYYVTRCYQTRHGSGWMSNQKNLNLINTQDEINVFNEWQKKFKIGELDYELLRYSLDVDAIYSGTNIVKNIVVTCLDQRPGFQFKNNFNRLNLGGGLFYNSSPEGNIKYIQGI